MIDGTAVRTVLVERDQSAQRRWRQLVEEDRVGRLVALEDLALD